MCVVDRLEIEERISSRSNTTASRGKTELEHRNREYLVNAFSLTGNGLQVFIQTNTKFNSIPVAAEKRFAPFFCLVLLIKRAERFSPWGRCKPVKHKNVLDVLNVYGQ